MHTKVFIWIVMGGLLLIQNCAPNIKTTKFDEVQRNENINIDVYLTKSDIKRPYKEIGAIEIIDDRGRNYNDLLQLALKKAGNLGADGIVVLPTKKKTVTYIPFDAPDLSLHKEIKFYLAIEYVK